MEDAGDEYEPKTGLNVWMSVSSFSEIPDEETGEPGEIMESTDDDFCRIKLQSDVKFKFIVRCCESGVMLTMRRLECSMESVDGSQRYRLSREDAEELVIPSEEGLGAFKYVVSAAVLARMERESEEEYEDREVKDRLEIPLILRFKVRALDLAVSLSIELHLLTFGRDGRSGTSAPPFKPCAALNGA